MTITPLTGTLGASGQIICRVDNGQCGRSVASFNIVRTLVAGYNGINISRSRTQNEPIPTDANWPTSCYYRDLNYGFTLTRASANNVYTWAAPPPAQAWVNPTGQGTPFYKAMPPVSPSHFYKWTGRFKIRLRVRDALGATIWLQDTLCLDFAPPIFYVTQSG